MKNNPATFTSSTSIQALHPIPGYLSLDSSDLKTQITNHASDGWRQMVVAFFLILSASLLMAQAPSISYATPQSYYINQAITILSPANSGGSVPAGIYRNVSTFAGSGTSGGTDNANPLLATFTNPSGVTGDALGNHYVCEQGGRIRKIAANGTVTTLASSTGSDTYDIIINPANGDLYFTASQRIYRMENVNSSSYPGEEPYYTNGVQTVAGQSGYGFINGTGTAAKFNTPVGLAISPDNSYLLVADYYNHRVRKIVIGTWEVSTFAGTGTAGGTNTNDPLTSTFYYPYDIAFASATLVYVSEGDYAHRIRKIDNGTVSILAGSDNGSVGELDGSGSAAGFDRPWGLTVDGAGNLYVAERGNYKVRKVTPSGIVSTIAGKLWSYWGPDNGLGINARFDFPMGIYFDPAGGYLLETDHDIHKIRKIDLSGYQISHPLPAGLTFNQGTGAITGTPTSYSLSTYYSNNFDDATASTTSAGGSPILNTNAELVGGMLRLTKPENNQYGGFLVPVGGANSNLLKVDFNLITGGVGSPGDGISYSFAPDADVTNIGYAEDGTGSRLKVSFSDYGGTSIRVLYNTTQIGSASSNGSWSGGHSVAVSISVNISGQLTLKLDGVTIFDNYQLPDDYTNSDKSTWKHVFKARTGWNNDLHGIDDLVISQGLGQATYDITAYNYEGSSTTSLGVLVTNAPPAITNFTPASGAVGTLVTITGTNLSTIQTSLTI